MDIQEDIKWIQSELDKVNDPDIVCAIKHMLKYYLKTQSKDWSNKVSEDGKEEIPQWQKDILDKRLKEHEENPDIALDFDQAMSDIDKDL